ncbi:MAG: hypothetical protein IKP66_03470, partial [Lachnospiraceae bacterium]|nr:hypothetical protein [Lachnospiraceae bacterium]
MSFNNYKNNERKEISNAGPANMTRSHANSINVSMGAVTNATSKVVEQSEKVVSKPVGDDILSSRVEAKLSEPAEDVGANLSEPTAPEVKVLFAAFEAAPFIKTGGLG